jgi:hypothetical protein
MAVQHANAVKTAIFFFIVLFFAAFDYRQSNHYGVTPIPA